MKTELSTFYYQKREEWKRVQIENGCVYDWWLGERELLYFDYKIFPDPVDDLEVRNWMRQQKSNIREILIETKQFEDHGVGYKKFVDGKETEHNCALCCVLRDNQGIRKFNLADDELLA